MKIHFHRLAIKHCYNIVVVALLLNNLKLRTTMIVPAGTIFSSEKQFSLSVTPGSHRNIIYRGGARVINIT